MQLSYVVFVKSSDKLLNYLMFGQPLIEMKMETHEFQHWRNFLTHSCDRREDGSHVNDWHWPAKCHFGYPNILSLIPDIMIKINLFDDLNKTRIFLLNRLRILLKLVKHYIFVHKRTGFAMGSIS